jgi:cytochrome P450
VIPTSAGALSLVRDFRRDPLGLLTSLHEQHGPIVRLRVPGRAVYSVSDPAAIQRALTRTHREYHKGMSRRKDPSGPGIVPLRPILGDGLLTSEAALHRRQRRLIQPMFHRARVAEYESVMAALAEEMVAGWIDGEVRDVHRDFTELTLAIIARTVFDVALDDEVITTIRTAIAENQPAMSRLVAPPRGFLSRRWKRAQRDINTMLYELIAARRSAPPGHDVLSLLVAARDPDTGEPMSDTLIRDEAMTLLLAGHETTANGLAWTLHLLATSGVDDADLRSVWLESLRLYPPAWLQTRRLIAPETVCGYELPAGTMLLFCPWVVHRDPQWWPSPVTFDPSRWRTGGERPRFAYFPFGGGPRQCIGNDFADLEGVTVLAAIRRRFRVEMAPDTPPVVPAPLVTLRPRYGVHVRLRSRPAD